MTQAIAPEQVDVRTAVGLPYYGEQPIKLNCPAHIHKARTGQTDDKSSLAVYRHNIHCFGCDFHIKRRYAALAFALGLWDGIGDENSAEVGRIIGPLRLKLEKYRERTGVADVSQFVPKLDPYMWESFQQYLFRYKEDRLVDELMVRRGLSVETIRSYGLGHTGTHFSIPVFLESGELYSIRFRSDEEVTDRNAEDSRKYEGLWGRNQPTLYPMQALNGLTEVEELWIVEGEFDAISSNQEGNVTLTITNGAGNISKIVEMIADQFPTLLVGVWVIATDQDGAGDRAAESILKVLSESGQIGVRARWDGYKDLTDYYASGGNRNGVHYEQGRGVLSGH